ncbi:MAG: tryptophan synthase subunit alpha [Burkholderiales bacterium]
MSRIAETFRKLQSSRRKALIPFVTAGDPAPALTVPILHTLVKSGADILELGVPFSDPMADGPTIQRSSERALRHGVGLKDVLAMVREFRARDTTTPVVLMGYANPIEAMGQKDFAAAARDAGVDGVLVVDYPPEESGELTGLLKAVAIDSIFLLSPTSEEARIQAVGRLASGYVYYVSLKGVTGAAHLDLRDVEAKLPKIRTVVGLPIGVGFGIRDAKTAKAIASIADAVVIGSRLIEEIEASGAEQLLGNLATLLGDIRKAMDGS